MGSLNDRKDNLARSISESPCSVIAAFPSERLLVRHMGATVFAHSLPNQVHRLSTHLR
jgi:hypothetical protein